MGSKPSRDNRKHTHGVEAHARAEAHTAKGRCSAEDGGDSSRTLGKSAKQHRRWECKDKQAKVSTGPGDGRGCRDALHGPAFAENPRRQPVSDIRKNSSKKHAKRRREDAGAGKSPAASADRDRKARRALSDNYTRHGEDTPHCSRKISDVAGADEIERGILEKGTIKDKINTLTLLVARDPQNDDAFSLLLDMCCGQRNDVVFYVLKNATDLILDGFFPLDKKKFKKDLEEHARNRFIQDKVLRLVYALLKKGVLVGDILHIFINRLGAKECSFVMEKLETMYHRSKELVLKELRTFYYKYSDLRGRNNVMKLLNAVCGRECLEFFVEVFNGLDLGGKSTQGEKLVERSVNGLYKLLVLDKEHAGTAAQQAADSCRTGDSAEPANSHCGEGAGGEAPPKLDVGRLVQCCKKKRIAVMSLSVLSKVSGTAFMETLLGSLGRESLGSQAEFLNMIYDSVKENRPLVVERLLSTALHMNSEFICGAIILMKAFGMRLPCVETLLASHFSPAVRYLLVEDVSVDPFRTEDFQKLENIAATYFAEACG